MSAFTDIPSFTWGNRPDPTTVTPGVIVRFSDVGENGALFTSNGVRWCAVQGQASLKFMAAASANVAASETIALQAFLPAGLWHPGDIIRIRDVSLSKSGTTDAGNVTVRVGAAGTTADTPITGLSALAVISAANQSYGGEFDIRLVSSTSALRLGSVQAASFAGGAATAASAATAITSAAANGLFVSFGIASSGATNTVQMQSGQIQLITP